MIRICQLDKKFGSTIVLNGISMEIPEGAIATVMGPSGSGKTTLLRLVAGLETPDGGEIYLENRLASSPDYLLPPYMRRIGMVFQHPALWPHMTVAENIAFGLSREKKPSRLRRVHDLLEKMEIGHLKSSYPAQISGGQARRVALARALAPRPRLVLLDEPLINLEERLQKQLLELIRDEQGQEGFTAIYVTHDQPAAHWEAGSVWILEGGTVRCAENQAWSGT